MEIRQGQILNLWTYIYMHEHIFYCKFAIHATIPPIKKRETFHEFQKTTVIQYTDSKIIKREVVEHSMAGKKPVLLTLFLIPVICFILCGNNKAMGIEKNDAEDKNISKFYEVFYKLGDRGQHIKEVQAKLNKFGYGLTEDGFFGPSMRRAVIDFQWRHGLVADGVVRHSTMVNLLKDPTPDTMYKPKPKDVSEAEKKIHFRC